MQLDGQTIVLAGGMGGLGRIVVPMISNAGARIVILDREAPRPTHDHPAFSLDVTDEAQVNRTIASVIKQVSRIDCVMNLVGGFAPGNAADTELTLWQKMLSLNVTSAFLLSKAVLPHMTARRSGRLIHIAALAAVNPFPGAAAYLVAKSALISLIRVLALELTGSGVTVNGVLPTTIDTPANRKSMPGADTSKWVKPEAIADLLIFLASKEAAALNGALIPIGAI
jgi:NAD(P)-dependent dehydrogenase (short-subunit alcohol dehydrogenase family)